MIVALARKLLIALWRLVTTGEVPEGVVLVCSRLQPAVRGRCDVRRLSWRKPTFEPNVSS
jgi:hypothetical protein